MPVLKVPKDLYIASSLDDLTEKTKIKELNYHPKKLVNAGVTLLENAKTSHQEGDEEKSYVLYMKFVEIALHIKRLKAVTTTDFEKKIGSSNVQNAVIKLEELKESLNLRYSKRDEKERKTKQESTAKPKLSEKNGNAEENVKKNLENGVSASDFDSSVSISSLDLRTLIQEGKLTILIFDTRPEKDFMESHMCFNNSSIVFPKVDNASDKVTVVNIPKDIIKAGLTPSSLRKTLPTSSLIAWSKRSEVDLIVLIDWDSCHASLKADSSVYILKEILTKWEIEFSYKRNPLILDGGYYDWFNTFPMMTTNPHVDRPTKTRSKAAILPDAFLSHLLSEQDGLDDLDDVVYPTIIDSPPKPPPDLEEASTGSLSSMLSAMSAGQQEKRNVPVIDRSSKPTAMISSPQKTTSTSLPVSNKTPNFPATPSEPVKEVKPKEALEDKPAPVIAKVNYEPDTIPARAPEIPRERNEALEGKKEVNVISNNEEKRENVPPNPPKTVNIPTVDRSLKAKILSPQAHAGGDMENVVSAPPTPPESRKSSFSVPKVEEGKPEETRRDSIEKVEEELKKAKPFLNENEEESRPPKKKIDKDIFVVPLKPEPSPGLSAMKRSRSLQNVSRLIDDQECPKFNRSNKPVHKTTEVIATRRRNFDGVYGNVGRGLTGLRNLGNSCYMNSILQCINHTTTLVKYFCDGQYRDDVNRGTKLRGEVAEEVAALVRALWSGEYRSIACRDLKGVVGMHKKAFAGHEQQDSHEFLTILMDWLHEDLNRASPRAIKSGNNNSESSGQNASGPEGAMRAWHEFCRQNESLVLHLFYGQQASTVCCLQCGEQSVTYEPFSNLSLPIPPNATRCTLADCMSLYLKGEIINGWNCPKCKEPRDASKKFDIWILPRILVIHFKRFTSDGWCRKRQTMVDFPLEDLDVSQWVGTEVLTSGNNPARKRNSAIYNLYGVSNHYGTMDGGHYTAHCKSSHFNKWFKFDDHEVSGLSPSEVVSPAAYILFYSSVDVS